MSHRYSHERVSLSNLPTRPKKRRAALTRAFSSKPLSRLFRLARTRAFPFEFHRLVNKTGADQAEDEHARATSRACRVF